MKTDPPYREDIESTVSKDTDQKEYVVEMIEEKDEKQNQVKVT